MKIYFDIAVLAIKACPIYLFSFKMRPSLFRALIMYASVIRQCPKKHEYLITLESFCNCLFSFVFKNILTKEFQEVKEFHKQCTNEWYLIKLYLCDFVALFLMLMPFTLETIASEWTQLTLESSKSTYPRLLGAVSQSSKESLATPQLLG